MKHLRVAVVLLLMSLVHPFVARAAVLANPYDALPTPHELGEGWAILPYHGLGEPGVGAAERWYGGPEGARLWVTVRFAIPPGQFAEGWANVAGDLDGNTSITMPLAEPVEHWPPDSPPIPGCTDVRREQGMVQPPLVVLGGATACLTTDGTIIWVEAQGNWSGPEAVHTADRMVQLILTRLAWMTGGARDLIRLLPPTFLPVGLIADDDGSRSLDDIAASFPSPTDASAKLAAWGWQANAFRTYAGVIDAMPSPSRVEVSLHRFAAASSAAAAVPYFAQGRAQLLGLQQTAGTDLRPGDVEIVGATTAGSETTLYTQAGPVLVRVTVIVPAGSGAALARQVADAVLGNTVAQ